jgi:hypothetical protein
MNLRRLTEEQIAELQRIEDECPVPVGAGRRPQIWPPVTSQLMTSEKKSLPERPLLEEQEAQAS